MSKMTDELPAELTLREFIKEVTSRAKRFKSPDVGRMPGVRYRIGGLETKRFFKSEQRRKKFMRDNDIDCELIN